MQSCERVSTLNVRDGDAMRAPDTALFYAELTPVRKIRMQGRVVLNPSRASRNPSPILRRLCKNEKYTYMYIHNVHTIKLAVNKCGDFFIFCVIYPLFFSFMSFRSLIDFVNLSRYDLRYPSCSYSVKEPRWEIETW